MNPLQLIAAATLKPVSLAEFNEHLHANKDGAGDYLTDEDVTLTLYLDAAIRACENKLQSPIMDSEWAMHLKRWPGRCVNLEKWPVSAINSVKYYDEDGTLQDVAAENFRLLDFLTPAVLEFDTAFSAPSVEDREYPIVINFNAGFTAASGVSAVIRHSVLLEATNRYENRQSELAGTNVAMFSNAADNLLAPESMWL